MSCMVLRVKFDVAASLIEANLAEGCGRRSEAEMARFLRIAMGSASELDCHLLLTKDLPKKTLGVDLENDFETEYIVIPGKEKVLARLKKMAKSASAIYLAPDPDREGEAIAAHLAEELGGDSIDGKKAKKKKGGPLIRRVTFNEITKRAVLDAFQQARDIDRNLVDAQQTRRVLDRIVGYQVSPLLWDKVRRGISAGRVQTVALRLIVDREQEIQAFKAEEYWSIAARLEGHQPPPFEAKLAKIKGKTATVSNQAEADHVLASVKSA